MLAEILKLAMILRGGMGTNNRLLPAGEEKLIVLRAKTSLNGNSQTERTEISGPSCVQSADRAR
jgi:hypothetical protein